MAFQTGADSLRPVRWPRLPTNGALLRTGMVAVLLGLAALVLDGADSCSAPEPGPSAAAVPPSGQPIDGASDARHSGGVISSQAGSASSATASGGRSVRSATAPQARSAGSTAGPGAGAAGSSAGDGGAGRLPLPPGAVGVPVRLAEPAALSVLRPGARVDLLVVPAGRGVVEAVLLAPEALVLDVVGADVGDGGSALYLALRPEQARRTVSQPEGSRFTVVVRG
ncbi:flagellar biosynthesis protein FlgA [Micromonospora sp. KC721]|uniref:flagellar biosynthesis protein FlgA n=1 Tax=Micromonospora sp. KC721 TaxID=2530380 RepID=UPI001FB81A6A|nr:flagellar biosynthesis protein FlgA [Micromonospora sp. KC721]